MIMGNNANNAELRSIRNGHNIYRLCEQVNNLIEILSCRGIRDPYFYLIREELEEIKKEIEESN